MKTTNSDTASTSLSRRQILMGAAATLGSTPLVNALTPALTHKVDDEAYWRDIAAQYDVTPDVTNLENGYWGIMARPVLKAYLEKTAWVNEQNTYFARRELGSTYRSIRETTAQFLNVDVDEIELTRGATEALQALIGGYNKLQPGDTVLYADLDYSEMKNAMRWLADRRAVNAVQINFPEPTKDRPLTEDDIFNFYDRALSENPKTKLLLLTHLNNWTGLIIPVKRIAERAKESGVDVILDAAHSVGQVDFDMASLGCDFVGVNLHKWVGAPIGCGIVYIRKNRIPDIDTYMGKHPGSESVTARIDTGTSNFAAHMTIPSAIEFHNTMGSATKEARLRYLRSLWVDEARKMKGLAVLTPDTPSMVAGLTSFRLDGITSTEDNNHLMSLLAGRYGVLTTRRTGPAAGDCIRVTPSFYNTPDDMMKLVRALRDITA